MHNLYRGVNPHLNSRLQTPESNMYPAIFSSFHATFIVHIADALNDALPPDYVAHNEASLQVRGIDEGLDLDPDERLHAVVIRRLVNQYGPGHIVTRIELLSPSNTLGRVNHKTYTERRLNTLRGGVPLVEVDFLHESRSSFIAMPIYPGEPHSSPYTIIVYNPRSNFRQGSSLVYGFRVDEPIPTIPLPLVGEAQLMFDFDQVYQHSLTSRRWHLFVDQTIAPARFETYSHADQERIRKKMNKIGGDT